MVTEEKYMQRCIELAQSGAGSVSPNPMVGCVIVHENRIIGEGFHRKYGEAHAEVNAVNSVANPELLKESTLYVSLEPCAHHGRTPPCTDLIIEKQIPRVVIGTADSSPQVAGVTGKYFGKCQEQKPSVQALDDIAAEKLWQISEEIVQKQV